MDAWGGGAISGSRANSVVVDRCKLDRGARHLAVEARESGRGFELGRVDRLKRQLYVLRSDRSE